MPQFFEEKWKKFGRSIEKVSCVKNISVLETWWELEGAGATDFKSLRTIVHLNHRMVWVGRELSRPSSPNPCHEQGRLQPIQVAQSPIQSGLEWFQGWGISHLSGQPVPGYHDHHCKKFVPHIQSKSPLF